MPFPAAAADPNARSFALLRHGLERSWNGEPGALDLWLELVQLGDDRETWATCMVAACAHQVLASKVESAREFASFLQPAVSDEPGARTALKIAALALCQAALYEVESDQQRGEELAHRALQLLVELHPRPVGVLGSGRFPR